MRLLVIGANGRTGTEVLDLAGARGHEVTAFVRSPEKVTRVVAGRPAATRALTIVQGDARRAGSIAAALPGHSAVISTIGPHLRDALRPSTLLTDCARATVDAMKASGVARLAIVSAAVLFPEPGLYFALFRWLIRHHVRDLRAMEHIVQHSGLDWTIARAPRLHASASAGYRASDGALPRDHRSISFRSVAAFLLDAVEQHAHVAQIVGLARSR